MTDPDHYEISDEEIEEACRRYRRSLSWKQRFWLAINRHFERICCERIVRYHQTGVWDTSIRFRIASRIEFATRNLIRRKRA